MRLNLRHSFFIVIASFSAILIVGVVATSSIEVAAAAKSDWKTQEAEKIALAFQNVVRKDDILELRLRNGKAIARKNVAPQYVGKEDSPRNRNDIISFYFVDYLRDVGYFVVWEVGYEWDRYTLISDTSGKVYEIEDYPNVSPDKKRIAAVSHGMEFRPGGIFIWRLENGIPVKETAFSALGTEFKEWKSSDSFVVIKLYKERITFSLAGGAWRADKPEVLSGW